MLRVVLPDDLVSFCSWVSWASDCDNEELPYVALCDNAYLEEDSQTTRLSCKL